jgi:tartrate dehydrogenase/decarboxylase / D-malate dehydrogenase
MDRYRVAVVAGDGVGQEVIPAGLRVLQAVAQRMGSFALDCDDLPWGSTYYLQTGRMMPPDGLETLAGYDAIYLGAVGSPDVPDHITLWGLLLPIRQRFNLYVNLRPIKLLPGVRSPLRDKGTADIDMLCVRENTEGEYVGAGGRAHMGFGHEVAIQTDVFTRTGVEQVMRFAFEQAQERRNHLTSITKSNASPHAFVFWDEIFEEVARDYPEVRTNKLLVDAAAAAFITRPESFDVLVASNLFGDILTDLGAAIQGSMGLAASANINPKSGDTQAGSAGGDTQAGSAGGVPGMFEPVHGSAPDIAGQGIANPLGAIWAGALMLDYLGQRAAGAQVLAAMAHVLEHGKVRTRDLGGSSSTEEVAEALISAL